MSFENYLKVYAESLHDVSKETFDKYPDEAKMLFEFIDNWIDLFPKEDERFTQATNSLSGIVLINSWKLTNWISYEILHGQYLEAIRNLRFVFEGCVFSVIIEDAVESQVFSKWKNLGDLWLKIDIFKLWEHCKKSRVYKNGTIDHDKIGKIVSDFVIQTMDPSRKNDIPQYIEVYTKILTDERLYFTTNSMIEQCRTFLKIDEKDITELKQMWHELSGYTHFSHRYLEAITEDPDFCFIDKLNDGLFKSSTRFYFQTLDFFYAVVSWRLPFLHDKIKEMCDWWKSNFNKTLSLTEEVLKNTGEQ